VIKVFVALQTAVVPMSLEITSEAAGILNVMPLPAYSSYKVILQVCSEHQTGCAALTGILLAGKPACKLTLAASLLDCTCVAEKSCWFLCKSRHTTEQKVIGFCAPDAVV